MNIMKFKFKINGILIKVILIGLLISLTACMSAPKVKPIADNIQPEFLYTQNLWRYHKPYDIRKRLAPIISGLQSTSYSINQSISSAYNIQAAYISAENKRLMHGYQYQNTLYNQKLEAERNKNLARIKAFELEQKKRHANISSSSQYKKDAISWYDENQSLSALFDPKNGLFIEATEGIVQPAKDLKRSTDFRSCKENNRGLAPEFKEDCR